MEQRLHLHSLTRVPIDFNDRARITDLAKMQVRVEVILTEDVEVVVIEEDTSTPIENAIECPYFFTATEEDEIETKEENEINDYEQNYGEDV